jgi:hypothetical protein
MSQSDRSYFSIHSPRQHKNGQYYVDPKDRENITNKSFDDFLFLYSNMVCGFEHKLLSDCFAEGKDGCAKLATEYGNCLYRRFDKVNEDNSITICKKRQARYLWAQTKFNEGIVDWFRFRYYRCLSEKIFVEFYPKRKPWP